MSEASKNVLARLLETRTGQQIEPARHWRIETALQVLMRERGFARLEDLVAGLRGGRLPALSDAVVDALLNNETYFFRDRGLFAQLFGALERIEKTSTNKRIVIWCAGCSTGQEVYSLAMTFADEAERWKGWTINIVGTDVSRSAIGRAQEGVYSQFEIQRGLPVGQMMRWFTRLTGNRWRVSSSLRRMVRFEVRSLSETVPDPGLFDIILCRNVLLYLAPDMRRRMFECLAAASRPGAWLMLGAAETVIGQTERFIPDPELRGLYVAAHEAQLTPAPESQAAA